jgi:cell division protein FtsA
MFDRSEIIVGLEIGTTKVCAVVGEADAEGALQIIGVGTELTRGAVRKGEIVNRDLAEEAIRGALAAAEESADVELRRVYLSVTGSHIEGNNYHGVHPIASVDREIEEEDLTAVARKARPQLTEGREVLHALCQGYRVDGQGGVDNPLGRFASRLEVDVHVLSGQITRLQNPVYAVKGLGLQVEDLIFAGRASARAALSPEQCEQGALLIDLGAGTTEYVVYHNRSLRHSRVIAVGGEHVSNDISVGLKLSNARAEKLKLEHGAAMPDPAAHGQTYNFTSDVGLDNRTVSISHLHQIVHARLEELLLLIRDDLAREGLLAHLRAGVVLTGGGARMSAMERLAAHVFQMPAQTARATVGSGPSSILDEPECSTALGLVKLGAQQRDTGRHSRTGVFNWLAGKLVGS